MEEIGLEDARKQIGEVVDRARLAGQHTRITRQGKPAAVVVPVEWYEQAQALIGESILNEAVALYREHTEKEEKP